MEAKDIFVSYSIKDQMFANEVVEYLESKGIECWIAPRDIAVGSKYYQAEIASSVIASKSFLLVLSENAIESDNVYDELALARKNNKRVIPFKIEDCTLTPRFELYLGSTQFYDATRRPIKQHLENLEKIIRGNINSFFNSTMSDAEPKNQLKTAEENCQIGLDYYYGLNGKPRNRFESLKFFQLAADQGLAIAQTRLAYQYDFAEGVQLDPMKAAELYIKAAKQGETEAQWRLGWLYRYGKGVKEDHKRAFESLRVLFPDVLRRTAYCDIIKPT
ncbi:MAG: toll/interleukin-1 receptor domain-containing protein [Firmicutes bacterium]|nr:toll/interleukin-1 receptor domain-containing protein [Bacillota bacterium]